jgi:hypothetical protein
MYVCMFLLCIYLYNRKKTPFSGPQKQHFKYITRSVTLHKTSRIYMHSTYIFENEFFPTTAVQQRQHVNAAGCGTFFSDLINVFVFDILQIRSGCTQIFSGCTTPATGLTYSGREGGSNYRKLRSEELQLSVG